MTDIAVCRGLHKAIRGLQDESLGLRSMKREGEPGDDSDDSDEEREEPNHETSVLRYNSPLYWVPYVRFGV